MVGSSIAGIGVWPPSDFSPLGRLGSVNFQGVAVSILPTGICSIDGERGSGGCRTKCGRRFLADASDIRDKFPDCAIGQHRTESWHARVASLSDIEIDVCIV